MTNHLYVENITVTYGETIALRDITFGVGRGRTTAVIGPSGCGKSTTLKAVVGMVRPASGRVHLDGNDITDWNPARRNVGLVPQNYGVFPHMNVRSNVGYGLRVRGMERGAADAVVEKMLALTKLEQYAERKPSELSGGQRQRVALARALAIDPEVLLLDEPLAALDPQLRGGLRRELGVMLRAAGASTLLVTHDQHEALALADEILILRDGRAVQYGTPQELWDKPASAFVADFLANSVLLDAPVRDGYAHALNGQWKIPVNQLRKIDDQRQPQLLIRRDSLEIAAPETEGAIRAKTQSVEYSGGQILVEVAAAGTTLTLTTAPQTQIGPETWVKARPGGANLVGKI